MNRLFGLAILLASCLPGNAQLPHWQSLGMAFDRPPLTFYVDSAEDAMYMVGNFDSVNSVRAEVVKWDGLHYTLLPLAPYGVFGPLIKYQGMLYANGNKGICRFNGTNWELTDTIPRTAGCFYEYQGKLWAPGDIEYKASMGGHVSTIATWDGRTWTDMYNVDTLFGSELWFIMNMAVYKGELYFGGNINPTGKPAISEIMRFDGQHWRDVGGGIQDNGLGGIWQLLEWKGDLYACGMFEERDGAPGNNIARWDGRKWHRLSGGVGGHGGGVIRQMAIFHDNLYVVGGFSQVDGIPTRSCIARWDGKSWCTLGDTASFFTAINVFKEELYVGGEFQRINSDSSFVRIAKWTGGDYAELCSEPLNVPEVANSRFDLYPNPVVGGAFNISINAIQAINNVDVSVRSLTGQEVLNRHYTFSGSSFSKQIDVRDVAKGVYFVEVAANGERMTKSVIIQ